MFLAQSAQHIRLDNREALGGRDCFFDLEELESEGIMMKHLVAPFLTAGISLSLLPMLVRGGSYDLRSVKGVENFQGSKAARELLGRNGFVVADPAFKQIFEPYIKSPQTEEP